MSLLVYEHITGGGYAEDGISSSILSEGYAMLKALTSDFKALRYNVTIFLDSRLKAFNPPIEADEVIPISSREDLWKALEKTVRIVDGVYVVAPESNHVLRNLVETVEASGGTSLNCRVPAIEGASNKMTIYKKLNERGIKVPETLMIDLREDVKQIKRTVTDLGFPQILKPLDGVSCCGLSLVEDESQILPAIKKVGRETSNEFFIAQRLIKGVAASVSLISTGDEVLPITLNKQNVSIAPPSSESSFNGGTVPLHHPSENEALKTAQVTVETLTGLRGYVGVDMVLTSEGPVVIEVNPRLTTSYVGLRRVVDFNPGQAIMDAVLEQRLPEGPHASGYASFLKVAVQSSPLQAVLKTYGLNGVLSPPFPVEGNETAYALLVSHSAKLKDAKMGLAQAKEDLLNLLS